MTRADETRATADASWTDLKRFVRRYMAARKARKRIAGDTLQYEIKVRDRSAASTVRIPDPEKFYPFVAAMHPLLETGSDVNLRSTWSRAKRAVCAGIPPDQITRFEEALAAFECGPIALEWNGRKLTRQEAYDLVAEGSFFGDDAGKARFLEECQGTPVGHLLWFQFYAHNDAGFRLATWLCEVIREAKADDRSAGPIPGEGAVAECIFCRRKDWSFDSEEHIFPESLTGDDTVLPRGYVCDRCNNVPLSGADEALVNFGPIAMQRVMYLPITKKGKFPSIRVGGLTVEKKAPRAIRIEANASTNSISNRCDLPDGQVGFTLRIGSKPDWKLVARALYKIALELVALKQGHGRALAAEYDAARCFVLGVAEFQGHLIIKTEGVPNAEATVTYWEAKEATPFEIRIFGTCFGLNLREGTQEIDERALREVGAVAVPLFGTGKILGASS